MDHNLGDFSHKPERGIALRVGVSAGDDGTMIEFTAIVPEHDADFLLNPMLDRLVAAGKRQRAKAQLPELRHERDATNEILVENTRRLIELDETFKAMMESREAELLKARHARQELDAQFQAEWSDSGRRGQYEARGEQKVKIAKVDVFITGKNEEQRKANEEHKVARSQLENEIDKRVKAIGILDRRIAECVALAKGEDISGVDDTANDRCR